MSALVDPVVPPMVEASPTTPGDLPTAGGVRGSSAGSLVLLYIEDHVESVSVMEAVLELRPAWRLVHAGLVQTGITAAHSHRPDLVLLDMHLPDGSGADVLTALKSDGETREIPVVILSAGTSATRAAPLLRAGAEQFWTKPHDIGLMLAYFDQIASRR